MKSRTAGFLLTLLSALPCGATQVGGLAWPVGQGGFTSSLSVGYAEQGVKDGTNDRASTFRNLLRAEAGLSDEISVYGAFGVSDIDLGDAHYRAGRGGSAGGGLRWGLVRTADRSLQLALSLDAEYLKVGDVSRTNYRAATYVVKQYGASGSIGFFYPYAGFDVSYANYSGRHGVGDFHSRDFIGVFAGADYFVSPNIYFSGEIHLFDESSAYGTVGYKF
jgi:hypothetical protein